MSDSNDPSRKVIDSIQNKDCEDDKVRIFALRMFRWESEKSKLEREYTKHYNKIFKDVFGEKNEI